ncbi:MAG: hypothetical protein H0T17_06285 [Propionibacteriales bacterium]|nr:hypothetical protein [Propionibacteriales bacterium]
MKAVGAVWAFLVDLIVGDDPKIAIAVVTVVAIAAVALAWGAATSVVMLGGAVLVVAAFTLSLVIDTRS